MNTLTQLIERYRTSPKVKQIAEILEKNDAPARLQLNGLMGAQESFNLRRSPIAFDELSQCIHGAKVEYFDSLS